MRQVRVVAAVATVILLIAACAPAANSSDGDELLSRLPRSVHGERLVYDVQHGAAATDWAKEVLRATGQPLNGLTSATAFTAPGQDDEYQSYIVRVKGADAQSLIHTTIRSFGAEVSDVWPEVVDGKPVYRYLPVGETDRRSGAHVYAFDDIVVVISSRRPEDARDALAQLP